MSTRASLRIAGVWVASGLLAAVFLLTGVPKLLGAEGWHRHFSAWGYPDWVCPVVGTVEVVSALLLLIPSLAPLGALGIVVVMTGATYTHLFRAANEAPRAVFTLGLLSVAAIVGYVRLKQRR
jgi:uncharacterized membrane protein YphA (DoxX/SURF4 family)